MAEITLLTPSWDEIAKIGDRSLILDKAPARCEHGALYCTRDLTDEL